MLRVKGFYITKFHFMFLKILFLVFLFSSQTLAQGIDTESEILPMQFEIPAMGADSFHVPPNGDVKNLEKIEKKSVPNPVEILRQTNSVQLFGQEEGGAPASLFIRGSQSDHVLQIWNGLILNDPSTPKNTSDVFSPAREFSHELTVLRGPQTLIYGSAALGGVIIWNRDSFAPSYLNMGGGDLENRKLQFEKNYFQGSVNVSFGGRIFESAGLSDSNIKPDAEKDRKIRGSLSGVLEWILSTQEKAEFIVSHSHSASEDDSPPTDDPNAKTENRQNSFISKYQDSIGPWNFQWTLTHLNIQRENRDSVDSKSTNYYLDLASGERWTLKQMSTYKTSNWESVFGFELPYERSYIYSSSAFSFNSFTKEMTEENIFNVWTFKGGQHEVSLGGRWGWENEKDGVGVYQAMYQYYLKEYKPYLLISTGYKRPSLYQKYSQYGDVNLESERSQSYEVGLNYISRESIELHSAFFRTDFQQLIDYSLSKSKYQNLTSAQNQGLELGFKWLESELDYTYLESLNMETKNKLLRRPYHQLSASQFYDLSSKLRTGIEYFYTGEREDNRNSKTVSMPEYDIFNFVVKWKARAESQFIFRINNIFDEDYESVAMYSAPKRNYWVEWKQEF